MVDVQLGPLSTDKIVCKAAAEDQKHGALLHSSSSTTQQLRIAAAACGSDSSKQQPIGTAAARWCQQAVLTHSVGVQRRGRGGFPGGHFCAVGKCFSIVGSLRMFKHAWLYQQLASGFCQGTPATIASGHMLGGMAARATSCVQSVEGCRSSKPAGPSLSTYSLGFAAASKAVHQQLPRVAV
jgi:hypothetical protein